MLKNEIKDLNILQMPLHTRKISQKPETLSKKTEHSSQKNEKQCKR